MKPSEAPTLSSLDCANAMIRQQEYLLNRQAELNRAVVRRNVELVKAANQCERENHKLRKELDGYIKKGRLWTMVSSLTRQRPSGMTDSRTNSVISHVDQKWYGRDPEPGDVWEDPHGEQHIVIRVDTHTASVHCRAFDRKILLEVPLPMWHTDFRKLPPNEKPKGK